MRFGDIYSTPDKVHFCIKSAQTKYLKMHDISIYSVRKCKQTSRTCKYILGKAYLQFV